MKIWETEMDPETWGKINPIQGWLTIYEGSVLYNLARMVDEHPIVEIGSWKGRSSCCLGQGSKEGRKVLVYCVDPFDGGDEKDGDTYAGITIGGSTLNEWNSHIQRLELASLCFPVAATSNKAVKNFHSLISLLFIDGNHSAEGVAFDFEAWSPKVVPGGYVALHDVHTTWPAPYAYAQKLLTDPEWHFIGQYDSLFVIQRKTTSED